MIARKPLPDNAAVNASAATATNPSGSVEPGPQVPRDLPPPTNAPPSVPAVAHAAPEPSLDEEPDAADSDQDSWERASASSNEIDDDDDDEIKHLSHDESNKAPAALRSSNDEITKEQQTGNQTFGNAALAVESSSSTPSAALLPAFDGGWEEEALGKTTALKPQNTGAAGSGETNPFRRKMSLNGLNSGAVPTPAIDSTPPPPLPDLSAEDFAKLNLSDGPAKNPWQPALDEEQKMLAPNPLSVTDQEPGHAIWNSQGPSRAGSTAPTPPVPQNIITPPQEKTGWADHSADALPSIAVPASFRTPIEGEVLEEDRHAWDDIAGDVKGKAPMVSSPHPGLPAEGGREEEWNLIDNEPTSGPSGTASSQVTSLPVDEAPALPPRSDEKAPLAPRRASDSGKTETYQVKNINWHDTTTGKNPRKSPILIQNANGPCPLMALVNALTITTPVSEDDAVLVNTLRTREQISLDLLLDAVFDELMSERRTAPDQALPDVTQLYSFLKGLHTGMNVNPRFIPTEETEKAFKRTSLTHLHPTERGDLIPGTFEDTQEMLFYRIFQVPLIHGWLPSKQEPVYAALERHAESYEDAQNILFREEELEDKLSYADGDGLTEDEQALYQDVLSIKAFLHTAATQLTSWGLEVITKAMRPGSVAILFRNDHFSTLYRHPQTLQIFTLVTDAGYAGHQEVVWESLVDVNGEKSEFFSGDFRPVGGPTQNDQSAASGSASTSNAQSEWSTAHGKRGKEKDLLEGLPLSPKEQEDRDLALALQLQEEEDQRHRADEAQRRRETQLSEQFIEQQSVRRGPVGLRQPGSNGNNNASGGSTSPRSSATSTVPASRRGSAASVANRGGSTTSTSNGRGGRPTQQVRPLVPPVLRSRGVNRSAEAENEDDAPPSYEDSARDRPYVPPAGHPSHPGSPSTMNSPRLPGSRVPGLAGAAQQPPAFRRNNGGYRQGVPPAAAGVGSRDRDCVVM